MLEHFNAIRNEIDRVLAEAKGHIKDQKVAASSEKHKEALKLWMDLNKLAQDTTDEKIIRGLKNDIEIVEEDIKEIVEKREKGKKEDGNIAFKCNWNDKNYRGICSDKVYEKNRKSLRSECARNDCRQLKHKFPEGDEGYCLESKALINCGFGAGWDHDNKGENAIRPRKILSVREGKIAILTTIPHDFDERLIVAAYKIAKIDEDPDTETFIQGDKDTLIDDMLEYKISFWKYHKNPNKPDSEAWGQGLFRYVSNKAMTGILKEYREKQLQKGKSAEKANNLLKLLV